jgi:hypothetical protein
MVIIMTIASHMKFEAAACLLVQDAGILRVVCVFARHAQRGPADSVYNRFNICRVQER